MKILLCHNHYQQPGGEDQSFAAEAALLERYGHEVVRYAVHNHSINGMSQLAVAAKTLWNRSTSADIRAIIRRERPAVMHCTNTFPLISPSAYYAARAEGVAVVQSLRNYRLMCPNALFMRDDRACEDCLGKLFAWPGVVHRCYRGSRAGSAVVASLSTVHRLAGTWSRAVDLYFTLTNFAREKFVAAGLPADRIRIKPNFVDPDPGVGAGTGNFAVFVGRLSAEKGVETLLAAWEQLEVPFGLKIIGDGPLAPLVSAAAERDSRIEWLGRKALPETLEVIGDAACLLVPSICYETFGRTIVEGFAKGTPAIVSRHGAVRELVDEGRTGVCFRPGDAGDLAEAVSTFLAPATDRARMRDAARAEYLKSYTAEPNYRMLREIYDEAIELRQRRSGGARIQRTSTTIERNTRQKAAV